MKKTAFMIVCNGEPFIQPQLLNIYSCVDEIVIVEGADKIFRQIINSINSTDDTIEIIKNFGDPENKIKLFQGDFESKIEMSKFGCSKITGDLIYQVDDDEFLSPINIEKSFELLENCECIKIPQRWYYKNENSYLCGNHQFETIAKPGRFFKNINDLYISHIPWSGYRKISNDEFIEAARPKYLDGFGYHFLAIYEWQLKNKMKYYALRGDCGSEMIDIRLKEFRSAKIGDKIESYYGATLKIDNNVPYKF